MPSPLFSVILHEPEIPNNAGNIGRTCVAVGAALHLIRPLGFRTDEKACRRAGLDYWPRLGVVEHDSWEAYLSHPGHRPPPDPGRTWLFTARATRTCFDAPLARGDHLVFGRESVGLPPDLLNRYEGRWVGLPMLPGERSLNVATAVCAVLYEGIRQLRQRGEIRIDASGRLVLDP